MSAHQPKKQRKLADRSSGLPFSPEQLQRFSDEPGRNLSGLCEQEQQELVVKEAKKLDAERCEAKHGDRDGIGCGIDDEEMICVPLPTQTVNYSAFWQHSSKKDHCQVPEGVCHRVRSRPVGRRRRRLRTAGKLKKP